MRRPASRPNLRRGAPLASSSVNNPPLPQPWTFSMGDSSDDEIPVPPMKFSAEVKSLLGDEASVMEGSSPSQQRKEEVRGGGFMRLDQPPGAARRGSPLALGRRWRERVAASSGGAGSRAASPRIVRLNATSVPTPSPLRSGGEEKEASPEGAKQQDYITPAPRVRRFQPLSNSVGSGSLDMGRQESAGANQASGGSQAPVEPATSSKEHSHLQDAEVQMGSLSINRTRGAEDVGSQTGPRQKRVQVTGKFLRGPARRGMIRRQSEETPNHDQAPASGSGLRSDGQGKDENPISILRNASPKSENPPKDTKPVDEQRPPHVRFQSQASVITGSPEQKHRDVPKEPLNDPIETKMKPSTDSASSDKPNRPFFNLPPMPPLPSRFDQENDPPPTFKRNRDNGAAFGLKDKFSIAQDEKMLAPTPATASPSRPALAVISQNTPRRPAPPPPKMSVLETATAPAGAASASQSKKKRNFMSVNGKMFTRLDCVGRGGSSKVYRVMAENFKIFALKRVTLEDQDELAVRGYKGEIELLRKLDKVDRVVRLYDYEINEEKHTLSVLMEIGESDLGKVLHQRLNAAEEGAGGGSFDITWTRYFWKEMLECVAAVHALNILHTDLKPANFLVLNGRLKLIDFGISNTIADDTVNVHREQHVGTPNYMSPEALIDTNSHGAGEGLEPDVVGKMMKLGKPSDVWSLGCILYQIVYGKPPFAHIANQVQRIMAIPNPRHVISFPATTPLAKSSSSSNIVPPGLIRTMKRCLQRDPTLRPTVDDLLSATDEFLYPDQQNIGGGGGGGGGGSLGIDAQGHETVPVSMDLIRRMQLNILKHVKEKGWPTEEEMRVWPERFYRSIRASVVGVEEAGVGGRV